MAAPGQADRNANLIRLMDILHRFVPPHPLPDDILVREVFGAYVKDRERPLVDPNE